MVNETKAKVSIFFMKCAISGTFNEKMPEHFKIIIFKDSFLQKIIDIVSIFVPIHNRIVITWAIKFMLHELFQKNYLRNLLLK